MNIAFELPLFDSNAANYTRFSIAMPSTLEYCVLDVFTKTPFQGNPLAIVHLQNSSELTQEQKLAITNEFNLSETVFLHPAEESDNGYTRRADIFTIGKELAFAGHPTIGAAIFIATMNPNLSTATLLVKAGPIPLSFSDTGVHATAQIPHNGRLHSNGLKDEDLVRMVPSLACRVTAAALKTNPVFSCVNGMTFALAQLDSYAELDATIPASNQTPAEFVELDEGWTNSLVGLFLYYIDPKNTNDDTTTAHCRMFHGLVEDPATGSACSALAMYMALEEEKRRRKAVTVHLKLVQGEKMGRKSDIVLSASTTGNGTIAKVELSGTAVQVMRGSLVI